MSYFYLSNLYRSYNIAAADLLKLNLGKKDDLLVEVLALIKGPMLECWKIGRGQSKLLASFDLNCKVIHFLKVDNLKGKDDSCLIVTQSGLILFFNISKGKLVTKTRMSIQGKNLEDIQIVYNKKVNSAGNRFISIFDKNSEILVLKITQNGDYPIIEEKFSVFSMIKGVLLFEVPEFLKGLKENDFVLGMVCGSQLYHHFISFLDINSKQKEIRWMKERKEINLASRDQSEIVQEKIFRVFHISDRIFVAFCAFSLIIVDTSETNTRIERLKMTLAEDIFVTQMESQGKNRFLYSIQKDKEFKSLLYLIEIPNIVDKDQISITFLGETVPLSKPPVVIGKRMILLISKIKDSVVCELRSEKSSKNSLKPFLDVVHVFNNLGIITNLSVYGRKKSLLVQSFKGSESLNLFQKGIVMAEISKSPEIKRKILYIDVVKCDGGSQNYLIISTKYGSRLFSLMYNFKWVIESRLEIQNPIIFSKRIHENWYYVCTKKAVYVVEFQRQKIDKIAVENTVPNCEFLCYSSHENTIATFDSSKQLTLRKFDFFKKSFEVVSSEKRTKDIRCLFFNGYIVSIHEWFSSEVKILDLKFKEEAKIDTKNLGVCSLYCTMPSMDQYQVLMGIDNGRFLYSLQTKESKVLAFKNIVVGNYPVFIEKLAGEGEFLIHSDESANLKVSKNMKNVEFSPYCHNGIRFLKEITFKGKNYYVYLDENRVKIAEKRLDRHKDHRNTPIYVQDEGDIDFTVLVGDLLFCSMSNLGSYTTANSKFCCFNQTNNKKLGELLFKKGEIEAVSHFNNGQSNTFLLGFSILPANKNYEKSTGKLKIVQYNEKSKFSILASLPFPANIRQISPLRQNHYSLNMGFSCIKVIKIEGNPRKNQESLQLKEILNLDVKLLIDCMETCENKILISDYFWTIHLFEFVSRKYPRLKLKAKISNVYCQIASIHFPQDNMFFISDNNKNIIVYKIEDDPVKSVEDLIKASKVAYCNIDDMIMSYKKGRKFNSLKFSNNHLSDFSTLQALDYHLMGGSSGTINAIYEIPKKAYKILLDLQKSILTKIEDEATPVNKSNFLMMKIKDIEIKRSAGVVDGSTVKRFLDFDDKLAAGIVMGMKNLDKPDVEDLKNLIRFLEKSPF